MPAIKPRVIQDFILVAGAAVALCIFGPRAHAGSLDQGPHILISTARGTETLAAFGDKHECLAVRDDLLRQLSEYVTPMILDQLRAYIICVPGRIT